MATKKKPSERPVPKWIDRQEAMKYMNVCKADFDTIETDHQLTISKAKPGGKKLYYRVSELDLVFENNIIRKTA